MNMFKSPSMPAAKAATNMPDPQDADILKKRRAAMAEQAQRGRAGTLLSDQEFLGG